MRYEILCDPTYAAVEVHLEDGERFVADSGVMAWMTGNVKTETSTRGGIMAGLKAEALVGRELFPKHLLSRGRPGLRDFCRRPRRKPRGTRANKRRVTVGKRCLSGIQ